ncbi:MAG: conjugal transfer protein, partial [Bacteroidaceae bacterium]|nr:conjugal transfer protein [Bacteroidaceae bacterium]
QTIALNSRKFKSRCILTEGEYPGLAALTPLHFIDYNPVIKVMDETDYPRLMESGKMFCRKVISGKSDELVRLLENRD